ncbi:MAG: signal peptidase I [Clostridium sp.]
MEENVKENFKEQRKKLYNKYANEIIEWAFAIVIALVLAYFIKGFVGTFTTVQQQSMVPTLQNNEKLWLNKLPKTFKKNFDVGDIVTFESPIIGGVYISNESPKAVYKGEDTFILSMMKNLFEYDKVSLIKRIVAKEGDRVIIRDGNVFVNDVKLKEEYLNQNVKTFSNVLNDFIVPKGYYFVMGDNRGKSTDSREIGCIPKEKIDGKVFNRVWPITKFGKVK